MKKGRIRLKEKKNQQQWKNKQQQKIATKKVKPSQVKKQTKEEQKHKNFEFRKAILWNGFLPLFLDFVYRSWQDEVLLSKG